jgi:hypothetical protein
LTEAPQSAHLAQKSNATVATAIGRCAEGMGDPVRLRNEVNALKQMQGSLADFASSLFELECARKGDADARANMLETADRLLTYWRDRSGDVLAAAHPALSKLWTDASALLISFESKRMSRALSACWEARGEAALLERAITDLTPAGDRRVEFATCLYHLELARLFVDSSRVEFARRIELVREAYLDPQTAKELVGDDAGLGHLWKDLVPYLDEFFEAQEQEEEAARKKVGDATDPRLQPLGDPLFPSLVLPITVVEPPEFSALVQPPPDPSAMTPDEVEIIEPMEPTPPPTARPLGVPPPPPSVTEETVLPPPLPRSDSLDSDLEVIELDEVPIEVATPVKSRRPIGRELDILTDYEPPPEAQAFWRHTEAALQLLPDPNVARVGSRVMSADGRNERKKLNAWLDGMTGRFADLPDARAMQCLLRLYMAAQVKEKTLFGQPNPKRKEAFKTALGLISADVEAAGRAAVWFELDGPETLEHLQVGLEVVADFLQFCAREKLDPLDGEAQSQFLGL